MSGASASGVLTTPARTLCPLPTAVPVLTTSTGGLTGEADRLAASVAAISDGVSALPDNSVNLCITTPSPTLSCPCPPVTCLLKAPHSPPATSLGRTPLAACVAASNAPLSPRNPVT